MALLFDGAKEATATTGTGTVTLGGAPPGFAQFSDFDLCTDGCLVHYVIEDGTSREVGIGTWNTGNTLSRTTIHNTLVGTTVTENPGTGLNLSGSAVVFSAVTADAGNDIDVTRYPIVRPSLNLDFSNSEQVDPRITTDRDTTATRVNEIGLIEVVANNEPRITYDLVTGECLGLLVEEQRVNLLPYSEQFDNAAWQGTATVSANTSETLDIYGTNLADKLTAANGVDKYQTASVTNGEVYTASVFLKRADIDNIRFRDAGTGVHIDINLSTLAITPTAGITAHGYEDYGNGWYRFYMVYTAVGTGASITIRNNNGTTGSWYVMGAQLELGNSISTYQPTTTSTVTRNADVPSLTSENFSSWARQSALSVRVTFSVASTSGTVPIVVFDNTTANERIALRINAGNLELFVVDGGTTQAQITIAAVSANTEYTAAFRISVNDIAASLDGAAVVSDTSATLPSATQLRFGSDGTNSLNGTIKNLAVYPAALTDAELQALTS